MADPDELYAAHEAAEASYRAFSVAASARRLPGDGYDKYTPEDQAEFTRITDAIASAYQAYLDALPLRWYVVAEESDASKDNEVWTLSHDPRKVGWSTDSGCGGYGLTFAEATELADAANAAWKASRG